MTTLVALSTKDAVVMGCDSLATVSKGFLDPFRLAQFFDHEDEWSLRVGADGKPILKDFSSLIEHIESVPYNHMTDVDKLSDLGRLPMGVMYTGITSIGDRTIKSLLAEFKAEEKSISGKAQPTNFTVKSIASRILDHFSKYYIQSFGNQPEDFRPALQFLVAGYDKSAPLPKIYRIDVRRSESELATEHLGIAFGGQSAEIERIVYGIDLEGQARVEQRYRDLLSKYAEMASKLLDEEVVLPDLGEFTKAHRIFGPLEPDNPGNGWFFLRGIQAGWGDFSDQNAIDCVAHFIGIMREGQRFNSRMPTVGGPIHIALIDRTSGFRFISREEYRHEDHRVRRSSVPQAP